MSINDKVLINHKKMNASLSQKSITITMVDTALRIRILQEVKPYLTADIKCARIWEALKKADYKQEGILEEVAIQILWDAESKNLKELLQVNNLETLKLLIDDDEDGLWNEDD
jgi:hypothetical protein